MIEIRDRYAQCDDTCTVDCGACKGLGRPLCSCWPHPQGQWHLLVGYPHQRDCRLHPSYEPPDLKPNDVVRYEPENRWCHDGYAVAEQRDERVILVDTYWTSTGNVVSPESYEVLFSLDDYEEKPRRAWETFAPADRRYIPKHSGYQTVLLVRKGAVPDRATQIENARGRVSEAEGKVRSARWDLECARRELAELEARAVTA